MLGKSIKWKIRKSWCGIRDSETVNNFPADFVKTEFERKQSDLLIKAEQESRREEGEWNDGQENFNIKSGGLI